MAKNHYRIHKDGTVWRSGNSIWHHHPNKTKELIKVGRIEGSTLVLENHLMRFAEEKEMSRSFYDFAREKSITVIVSHSTYLGCWLENVIRRANKKLKFYQEVTI
jgi:hypothetical protein